MKNYVEILPPRKLFKDQKTLTYEVPEHLTDSITPGQIVEVPLRKNPIKGLVLTKHQTPPRFATKAINKVAEELILSNWQIQLMQWMSDYYLCPLFKILPSFIPKKVLSNTKRRPIKNPQPQNQTPITDSKLTLNTEQQNALNTVISSDKKAFLLHGITGAGKTEIYLQLATHYTNLGKQVAILVPEISLTPQTVNYFKRYFHQQLSVIHSKLSVGEKIKAWEDIHSKRSKIIIGSRSSLFAPFKDIGLIILDEEHDLSYKQDQSPRYHAKDIALKISELTNCKVLLGSATPSIESFHESQSGKLKLLSLQERINNKPLPKIKLIDLRQERQKKNYSIFSDELANKIEEKLTQKEQVLLFLNKRGSSSSIICEKCGYNHPCTKCDIPFTFHRNPSFQNKPTLLCHHCGIIKEPPTTCTTCKSPQLQFYGFGTQKVESELQKLFPSARILRADKDTTSTKHAFSKIYQTFRNHEADILIGTQMISKGLHLPQVNLVGVILADIGVHIPDFRAHERTYQLLTQVAGRAGRKSGEGEVLIQTYNPENTVMQIARTQNFTEFYNQEIKTRSQFPYPPFSKLIKLTHENPDPKEAFKTSQSTKKELSELNKKLAQDKQAKISLFPAMIHKRNDKYRWCILINSQNPNLLINQIPNIQKNWIIDKDPQLVN